MKQFLRLLYFRIFRRFVYRIDLSSKCPACGSVKKHKIEWMPSLKSADAKESGVMLHTCSVCRASWGQSPIRPVSEWQVAPLPSEQEPTITGSEEAIRRLQSVRRNA
jgi:hypothetical protein